MAPAASTRWCPTPEQVMILEEMYRSGVRTPNAAQIQQITAHLSLYGQIEGKNVFYWFQNHKARDRQKLRKKLLGKQLHQHHHYQQQQQHLLFSHHLFPPFDHHNYFHHHFTNNNNSSNNYHHFDQPPPSLPPPPPTPPVAPPCCGSTASSLGLFNQLPPANSSHCLTAHQARAVDVVPRMTNTYTWNMETNSEAKYGTRENAMKPMMTMLTNNDHHHHHHDWMMMRKSSGDYHYHHHHHDSHNYNADDDDDSRRSIKTLELFPIKDKTSLKEDNNNNI